MIRKLLVVAVLAAVAIFAVQGGEYGTSDLLRQRSRRQALVRKIDSLQRVVDSLQRRRRAVESDAAVQERIAREEFGMVKGSKEILYRFAEPDSGR
jgi:cell division protein FtsB